MTIYFISKNAGKLRAVEHAFQGSGIGIEQLSGEWSEIQAETSLEVARYTAVEASKKTGAPCMREDNSIYLHGLGGMPGPFMAYVEKWMPPELICELLHRRNRAGHFDAATVLAYPDGRTVEFTHQVPFTIAEAPRGNLQTGWNQIIMLDGETRTLAEYPETERTHIWSTNYIKIRDHIQNSAN